jgi:hypothetical protein
VTLNRSTLRRSLVPDAIFVRVISVCPVSARRAVEGSAVPRKPRSGKYSLSNRRPLLCHPERSRGICGSAKAPVRQILFIEPPPSPLSSRAQPRDLQFRESLGPANTLYRTAARSFVIPSAAEGSAVPRKPRSGKYSLSKPPPSPWSSRESVTLLVSSKKRC